MRATSEQFASGMPGAFPTILKAGLLAGVMDITGAFVTYWPRGVSPDRILQSISSGLLGMKAYEWGVATMALGLLLHFVIATGAASVFYAVSRKLRFLLGQPLLWGPLYGIAVYFFMQLVVLPLSAFPHPINFKPLNLALGLIVHMICVGMPIVLVVSRASRR